MCVCVCVCVWVCVCVYRYTKYTHIKQKIIIHNIKCWNMTIQYTMLYQYDHVFSLTTMLSLFSSEGLIIIIIMYMIYEIRKELYYYYYYYYQEGYNLLIT